MVFINLLSANHVLFQLANLSLLTSFALTDLLLLRLALAIACTFFSMCVVGQDILHASTAYFTSLTIYVRVFWMNDALFDLGGALLAVDVLFDNR